MSEQEQARRVELTKPSDREIRMVRIFDAPRERIFAAHTDPGEFLQWWGSRAFTTTVDTLDVSSGGDYRLLVELPDGTQMAFRGKYHEVVPPERIVKTIEWEGRPGLASYETSTFEDLGEQTRIVITARFDTEQDRDGMLDAGMEDGVNESLDRLDELLARTAG
jgi:uncharacterized protein YndB with AHSA1/START domain